MGDDETLGAVCPDVGGRTRYSGVSIIGAVGISTDGDVGWDGEGWSNGVIYVIGKRPCVMVIACTIVINPRIGDMS